MLIFADSVINYYGMKVIKKLFLILSVAVCAVSCFGDDDKSYSASYILSANFEYGNVFKSDSLYFEKQLGMGLGYRDLAFYHKLSEDKSEFLGGFLLSALKGGGQSDNDRFRVNSGAGANKSSSYLVYFSNPDGSDLPEHDIEFTSSGFGTCSIVGCYVNNTKEVVNAVKASFADGDRLAVRMTGFLGGKKTGEQEFVLAEYTGSKDSLVTSWRPFELDKLGQVDIVEVDVISTRNDIPKAFCMDDMIARIAVAY